MVVSVIICTRDRARDLGATLQSLAFVAAPVGLSVELLVVDNGSRDSTATVVREAGLAHPEIRYLYEPRRGQCFARNTGITASTGEIIIFTDDDVRFPPDWLEKMCRPILAGEADGVAGSVRIAPHLVRDWMTPVHENCFAWDFSQSPESVALIGANMAFARRVLERVPAFDVELGPGRLGFSDDVLFTWQLNAAGFRLRSAGDCFVEHHFDPKRLSRQSFQDRAEKEGRVAAYLAHHWLHSTIRFPKLKYYVWCLLLSGWRVLHLRCNSMVEGCSALEMRMRTRAAFHRQYSIERSRPRNYSKHGTIKRGGEQYSSTNCVGADTCAAVSPASTRGID